MTSEASESETCPSGYYAGTEYAKCACRVTESGAYVVRCAEHPGPLARPVHKATADECGCYVDGWWGQYAVAHLVHVATTFGFDDTELETLADRYIGSMGHASEIGVNDDEYQTLSDAADEIEAWLNANAIADGEDISFGWFDGEFFLSPNGPAEDDTSWAAAYGDESEAE